jgi:glycosyltransferase involved in cell wall biosynthesis
MALNITFILPVLNETFSLRKTVDTLFELSGEDFGEILIVVADRTTPESMVVAKNIREQHPGQVRVHKQTRPFLGGAMQDAFETASGDHLMLMSSDLETDPKYLPEFIEKMRTGRWDIVASSRWIRGGGFEGYSRTKILLNWLFQKVFSILYWTRLTDLTYAYRLYRKSALEGIVWEELKHPFLLESLLKPLRLGARITEIPCRWVARAEGTSANSLADTFAYLRIAFKVRFRRKKYFTTNGSLV